MHNFTDYYSIMLARKLFQQGQQQIAETHNHKTPLTIEDIIPAAHTQTDPYAYAVFYNPGCGFETGQELQDKPTTYHDRWRAFYEPLSEQLPQHTDIKTLEARKEQLLRERAELYAPRLAALAIGVVIAMIILVRDNSLLLLLPLLFVFWVWYRNNEAVDENNLHIRRNQAWIEHQTALLGSLEGQLKQDKQQASIVDLQRNYTLTLEKFLHSSVQEFFPTLSQQELSEQLGTGEVQLFVLESRGILQLPGICQHSADNFAALEALIHKTGKGLCALQPFQELEGMTRLHYLYGMLCFEQGVLLCTGFYDWVGNRIHGKQRDFYSYRDITHLHHNETSFPEKNQLRDELPDEVWQQHFSQPVQVVSLGIRNGSQHCCVLPKQQVAHKTWLSLMPNTFYVQHLKRDTRKMVAVLTGRLARGY